MTLSLREEGRVREGADRQEPAPFLRVSSGSNNPELLFTLKRLRNEV